MMTPDSSDEENTSEDVPINGIEDAEVAVVWPDCVAHESNEHFVRFISGQERTATSCGPAWTT